MKPDFFRERSQNDFTTRHTRTNDRLTRSDQFRAAATFLADTPDLECVRSTAAPTRSLPMPNDERARIPAHTPLMGHLVLPSCGGPRELCRMATTPNVDAIVASVLPLLLIVRDIEQVDDRARFRASNAQRDGTPTRRRSSRTPRNAFPWSSSWRLVAIFGNMCHASVARGQGGHRRVESRPGVV